MSVEATINENPWRTDPTKLTTAQLLREIGTLKELLTSDIVNIQNDVTALFAYHHATPAQISEEVKHLRELIEARLSSANEATKLLQSAADRTPVQVDEKIAALANIHNEKFASIQKQFTERDARTDQSSRDSKVAVDAALQAAKEAVGEQNKSSALAIAKSEASTDKRTDQMGQLMLSGAKSVDDKFNDIKDRLALIEGRGTGVKDSWGYIVGFAGIAYALFMAMHK